jgi:hypothetical protein
MDCYIRPAFTVMYRASLRRRYSLNVVLCLPSISVLAQFSFFAISGAITESRECSMLIMRHESRIQESFGISIRS